MDKILGWKKPVRLHLWVMPDAGFDTRKIIESKLKIFKKSHPGVEISLSIIPWSQAWDRLMNLVKREEKTDLPDVIQVGNTWTATLAYLGAIAELTDEVSQINKKDYIPQSWKYCYLPGNERIFAVPWFTDLRVLYYRRDILKKFNLDEKNLIDWKSFEETCRIVNGIKLNGRRHFALSLSGQREEIWTNDLAPWIWGSGGDFFSEDLKKAIFQQKGLEGISFFFNLIVQRFIPLIGRDTVFPIGNFFTGNYTFQFSGMWPIHSYFNPHHSDYSPVAAKNYGVTSFPSGPAGRSTFIGGSNLVISRFTKHFEQSWQLIAFLSRPEVQSDYARNIGKLPCQYAAWDELFEDHQQVGNVFRKSLQFASALPVISTFGTIEKIISDTCRKILDVIRFHEYSNEILKKEFGMSAKDVEHILSLYD
ncbi:MAG: extracellular solute-binding protein [Elusimicrobiota bacterium]